MAIRILIDAERAFFRAERIFVTCSGISFNTESNRHALTNWVFPSNGSTTLQERVARAEIWEAQVYAWGDVTSKLLYYGRSRSAVNGKRVSEETGGYGVRTGPD